MLAPTLVVGLGGIGSRIVSKVSNMISDEQRSKIGFVVFDTDVNELESIKESNIFIKAVQTSTRLSVGEYLNIDTHARDNWFPVNRILSRKTLTEGAGQVRAISRLALDTAIRAGNLEPLHNAIEDLYKLESDRKEQALRVIIVSSLAGGTGSGLILPVAMYIRNFLQIRFQQCASITRGFFILPEVFYEVIKGQAERNNLKCNAYATLRELDAFLMKGDGTLPARYKTTMKFEFPRVASHECEEYDVMPFDFCFLFDAQNVDGKKLNSFNAYLDHAANCIYAQSIGPMNKRSNSSEDNTIRELCKSGGRNRYAGAGSSILKYPYEDVKNYIAFQWASRSISDQWMLFDRQFKERCRINNEQRSKGFNIKDPDQGKEYIASVDAGTSSREAFASSVKHVCFNFDESGLNQLNGRWEQYIGSLNKHVERVSAEQKDLNERDTELEARIAELQEKTDNQDYIDIYQKLAEFRKLVDKNVNENAEIVAYTLFNSENASITKERKDFQLETYLRDETGRFIHPNAVRYFLYNTIELLEKHKIHQERELEEREDYFKNFEKNNFDDPKTEDKQEGVQDLASRKKSLLNRLTKKPEGWQKDLREAYVVYFAKVKELRVQLMYKKVLEAGIDYARKMSKAFEFFFNSFESSVGGIGEKIHKIETKYEDMKGSATRYVCVSKKCLDRFNAKMVYTGSALTLPSDLCEDVFLKVRNYSILKEKVGGAVKETYFQELFDSVIMEYFRKSVMESYGGDIKIDIISALEKEIQFEEDQFDKNKVREYVIKSLKDTKHLSEAFIEKPLGEQKTTIPACAFNPKLRQTGDPDRESLVDTELMNDGGISDEDIPENIILFYKAIYGLRANELSKFAPPAHSKTITREAGEYYKAYFELINQIKPKSEETPVITPHIDKSWHIITSLPDLDEENQTLQENNILKAFFLGIIFKKIQYWSISKNKFWYRLSLEGSNAEDFVVSNGTPCDNFYEILDACIINPIVVKDILKKIDHEVKSEILTNKKLSICNCELKNNLDSLELKELELEAKQFAGRKLSIFDIPTFLKISTPADIFREDFGMNLLKISLDFLYEYISYISPPDKVDEHFISLVLEQYEIFLSNTKIYNELWPSLFGVYINSLLSVFSNYLGSRDMTMEAKSIQEDIRKFNNIRIDQTRASCL